MINFFSKSLFLDYEVLKPLSHIKENWELVSDEDNYYFKAEDNSYSQQLNKLIKEIEVIKTPKNYHNNEDIVVKYIQKKYPEIKKTNGRWSGMLYKYILYHGGYYDDMEQNLIQAVKGRIMMAKKYNQNHYDDIEDGHREIIAHILISILYYRTDIHIK